MKSNIPEQPEYILVNKKGLIEILENFKGTLESHVTFFSHNPQICETYKSYINNLNEIQNLAKIAPPCKEEKKDPNPFQQNDRFKIQF